MSRCKHPDHKRPVTRRDFIAQGFLTGAATVMAPATLGLLLNPRLARALSPDINPGNLCNIQAGAGKIPFICFDLAGGANIAGSNVLVGQQGGQLDFLSTAGYSKLGLPGNMTPASSMTNFIDQRLGLAFHTDSAFLRGMMTKLSAAAIAGTNGAVIAARSENDTGNNPHNPDVRHRQGRCQRTAAHAHWVAQLGFGRQLNGARDDDRSEDTADEGRSHQRRDRPGGHGRARYAAAPGRYGGGHGVDGAPQRQQARCRGYPAPGTTGCATPRSWCTAAT